MFYSLYVSGSLPFSRCVPDFRDGWQSFKIYENSHFYLLSGFTSLPICSNSLAANSLSRSKIKMALVIYWQNLGRSRNSEIRERMKTSLKVAYGFLFILTDISLKQLTNRLSLIKRKTDHSTNHCSPYPLKI